MNQEQENNITHQQARYYLHAGREQLAAAEQNALDNHLAGCADCCRDATKVAALQSRLAQTMRRRWQNHQPGPALNARIQARLQRKIRQRQVWRFANSAAAAAALLLLVTTLGWLAWRILPLPQMPVARTTLTTPASPQPPIPSTDDWAALPGLTTFGDQVILLGYSLSAISFAPGDTIGLRLYGQTQRVDITFFAHLFDPANHLIAQAEAAECPQVNRHSTDLVVKCAALTLPGDLPDGSYQLRVGVYSQAGGHRLTTPAGVESFLLTSLQVGLPPTATPPLLPTPAPTATPYPIPAGCPVTLPNGNPPPGQPPSRTYHGNGRLWTSLLPTGVLVPPENVRPDGKLTYNWWWWRGQPGQLTITGRRLDDLAVPPLEAEITPGFGNSGYQDSWLIFATEGCWEVTGQVGDSTLTFVVYVAKVDRLE